jgi:1-deoxy-D-xylulose-5-phosphate reductoisomerase
LGRNAPVDRETFPALDLAYAAGRHGGVAPACYNAANEEAVAAFISGALSFAGIPRIIERTLTHFMQGPAKRSEVSEVSDILDTEIAARAFARILIGEEA